ncbi:hypothetical protein [Streptomyces mirabilis]|uniref:hypothetical protein n=1 Tax=Streptomyces mirabilis TaxID=68239 RepID=UPI0036E075A0
MRDNSRRSNETVHHHHVPVGAVLDLAHSDHDLVVFLEAGGVVDPENVLDDPQLVQWWGAGAPVGRCRKPGLEACDSVTGQFGCP